LKPDPEVLCAGIEHLAWPKVVADLEGVLARAARA
jgi:hypothetical protein